MVKTHRSPQFGEVVILAGDVADSAPNQVEGHGPVGARVFPCPAVARQAGQVRHLGEGAGGGGFLLFYVQEAQQAAVSRAMGGLMRVPFAFEDGGTRVIHYTPETYIPREETQ